MVAKRTDEPVEEIKRLMDLEKQVRKLQRDVAANNYEMMQIHEDDNVIRSQVVSTCPFNAYIHKAGNDVNTVSTIREQSTISAGSKRSGVQGLLP